MAKLLKEDLIKSHIAFAKRLVAEGVDIQNMNDDMVDESVVDYFSTITLGQKIKFAQNAIESNDPEKLYNAIVNCFQFNKNSNLIEKLLKSLNVDQLKQIINDGLQHNFEGFLLAHPNKVTQKYEVKYGKGLKAGTFGGSQHKAIS